MGNIFSICTNNDEKVRESQEQFKGEEYRTLKIENRTYILFNNNENVDYIEI
tara:strand:+ start:3740 stop:3895 length:156 start_codon:yes stop_codon:yes gene_type:complete